MLCLCSVIIIVLYMVQKQKKKKPIKIIITIIKAVRLLHNTYHIDNTSCSYNFAYVYTINKCRQLKIFLF